jgi:DNA-binding IclR family transcriptional regulator
MPRISGEPSGTGIQAVTFALNTLEFLAQRQSAVGVSELARAFGTTKSRMHRHLQTLVGAGYIVREPETERYRVSTRLMALGQAISNNFDLTTAARPVLRELRDSLGHSVALSRPEADGVRIMALVPGTSQIEIGVKPGSILPFHSSAQGKVALAFADEPARARVLKQDLPMSTAYTIVDPRRLATELELVKGRGWAAAPNEALIGLNALAAPILDALGHLAGAVAIVDSIQFIGENPTPEQVRGVTKAAQRISAELGYR